ncbi:hypothetical protein PFICI_03862 [Pestalotiopsis fici W106-1]|uniref:Major facilitator superfamily (MFS) profile domain-containing protein n=1 Tax=Pestalotiopsis fici (strain W106-1 / CGMCC3.15140) TaxID=1229662 RepID=W3XK47_PESFW|nr:uncharacterized protein PFICI_03862 [Pestalotiopsis fici W106-1]ETS85837.1 hypothetical protein PFICI_03862 [Pestalotiopsis fici W106-1]
MSERTVEEHRLDDCTTRGPTDEGPTASASDRQAMEIDVSLPPRDTGKQAWLFLSACWVIEACTFGFALSFGVFQEFYSTHEPFQNSDNIAVIGTTTSAIMYLAAPFVVTFCRFYPRWTRYLTFVGLTAASLSMVLSSFCTSISQLIGAQGVMFGLSGCIAYCPCTLYIDEWFDRRKGLAYGIVWSAGGVGGVILTPVLQNLLNRLEFQLAMRIWACVFFLVSAPFAFFVKPRLPFSSSHEKLSKMRFATSKRFLQHQLANTIQALGFFLPAIYLPTYARRIYGSTEFLAALTVMLVNVSSSVGLVAMGFLSDKLSVTTCMAIAGLGSSVSVLFIWGLSGSLPVLFVFCVFFGLFGGSWTSTWPGIMREVSQRDETAGYGSSDPIMVHGHLCIGRGIGNIISGFLSDALTKGLPGSGKYFGGYGSGYGFLILFTGLTGLFCGANFVWESLVKRVRQLCIVASRYLKA